MDGAGEEHFRVGTAERCDAAAAAAACARVSQATTNATAQATPDALAAAFAAVPDGFGVVERSVPLPGVVDFIWTHANPALLRLTGETVLLGRFVGRDRADGGAPALIKLLEAAAVSGAAEVRIVAGACGYRRIAARGFGGDPNPGRGPGPAAPYVAVTVTDVNAFKEQEEKLRAGEAAALAAKREAEKAGRAKSEFLTHMSHELRTPLNAVIGFAELLKMETLGPLGNPRYVDYARDILDSGKRLLDLVNDALDLSRIDAGRMKLVEEMIDLAAEIAVVTDRAISDAHKRGISLAADPAENLPPLAADRRAVHQMLNHLVSNALKFTPADGSVLVTATRTPDGGVGVMVADTGCGIAEEDLERVVRPFGRTEMSVPHCVDGTGLGLPVVKRLMELHDGRLELDSVPGVGTTAILMFPARRVVAPQSLSF